MNINFIHLIKYFNKSENIKNSKNFFCSYYRIILIDKKILISNRLFTLYILDFIFSLWGKSRNNNWIDKKKREREEGIRE